MIKPYDKYTVTYLKGHTVIMLGLFLTITLYHNSGKIKSFEKCQ